jgi:AcrR family transcriptional regulator
VHENPHLERQRVSPRHRRRRTRAENQAETRRRLLDAAAEIFIRRGFQGATVEEITAEAGFTRGAFYSNFESKEQLFVEFLQERVYEEYRQMVQRVPAEASPIERLRWTARDLMERYERGAGDDWLFALWLETLAHAARNPEFRELPASFWSGTRAMLASQIDADFNKLGRSAPASPKHIAIALTALDIGLAVQHLVDPDDVPLSLYPELFELLFGPMIEGAETLREEQDGHRRRRT